MSQSSLTRHNVLLSLLIGGIITVEWFRTNGMETNPNKFQLITLSPNSADDFELKSDQNSTLRSEKSVEALGVIIGTRLNFNDHISVCCLKAVLQLNALVRISK